jgi:hypothetical protein
MPLIQVVVVLIVVGVLSLARQSLYTDGRINKGYGGKYTRLNGSSARENSLYG